MQEACVLKPVVADRASPLLFVPKKDESLRFCVDYRRFATVTLRDRYPIPRTTEFTTFAGGFYFGSELVILGD